ncbi:MAG: hypothetical protein U9N52_02685 [Campylobacterota bacterium]|nr:hypothetical protein [Campylobacterota bacterium]
MPHHIVVEKLCSCAKKHALEQLVTCNDRDDAYDQAVEIATKCNEMFCGKHGFNVEEVNEHYVISVETGGFEEVCEL